MRWRVAQVVFFVAGFLAIFSGFVLFDVVDTTAEPLSVYVSFAIVATAFLAMMITVGSLQRYPKVSYGRTALFFLTLYSVLLSLLVMSLGVTLSRLAAGSVFAGAAALVLVWALIVRCMRKKRFVVVPGGSVDSVDSFFDGRFDFVHLATPEPDAYHNRDIDGLVLDARREISPEWLEFVTRAQLSGLVVVTVNEFIERYAGRIVLDYLDEATVTRLQPSMIYRFIKRGLDLVVVAVTLPLSLILVLMISLLIRLESPGPVIFRQRRIGEGEKPFTIYKFRSMTANAEHAGPTFADEEDSRVTRIGRFIRQFRLDELPQFWNIVRGEMSLIGPRPEQEQIV